MSSKPVISFNKMCKNYILYAHFYGGIKRMIFHLPSTLRSLKKNKFQVLKDITFDIYKGENVGIVGRNGAGKSTTLGLVAGVLKPSSGSVEVNGRVSPLLELGGGFHPELTGRENIELNGVLLGMTRAEVTRKIDSIIEFSELGDFIEQPIRMYSSGMLARLGFSVIAHLDPEILLIDEVLSVGDLSFQKKCIDKMMQFKNSDVTIVLVSHSPRDILAVCDRVIWIEDHEIRMMGPAAEVMEEFQKVAVIPQAKT